jgi:YD repeat-containing protein
MKKTTLFLMFILIISCTKEDVPSLDGLLKTVSYTQNGNPDNSYAISYNSKLQIEKVTNMLGNTVTGYNYYHYDDLGNLTHIDNENGQIKKYLYNSKQQLIVFISGMVNDTIHYEYDFSGHMILERNKYWYIKYDYDNNNNRTTYRIYNNSDSLLAEIYNTYYTTLDPLQYTDPLYFDKNILSESYTTEEYEVNGSVIVFSGNITSGNSTSSRTSTFVLSTSQIELSEDKKILNVHKVYKNSSPDLWIKYEFY